MSTLGERLEGLVEELRAEAKNEEHVATVERATGRQAWGFQRTAEALKRYAFKLEAALAAAPSLHKEGAGGATPVNSSIALAHSAFSCSRGAADTERAQVRREALLEAADCALTIDPKYDSERGTAAHLRDQIRALATSPAGRAEQAAKETK